MAKRTDFSMIGNGIEDVPSFVPTKKDDKVELKSPDVFALKDEKHELKSEEVFALKGNIEQTRGEMSRTVNQIEERLSPAHIKEQIADVKDSLVADYHDAKDHIKADIATEVRVAKDAVKEDLGDAKQMVQDQLVQAKDAVVDATVGRVKEIAGDVKDMAVDASHAVKEMAVDAGHAVKEVAVDAGHAVEAASSSVMSTIRRNPLPVALLAMGTGWLAVNMLRGRGKIRARQFDYEEAAGRAGYDETGVATSTEPSRDILHRVGDKASGLGHRVTDTASKLGQSVSETAQDVRDRAVDVVHDATARVGDLGHRVSDGAASMAHSAGEAAHDARDRAVELMHDAGAKVKRAEVKVTETYSANPLPFGAAALALGAALGLALPHTAREDSLMGEAKGRLLHSAGEMAQTAIHSVQEQAAQLVSQNGV